MRATRGDREAEALVLAAGSPTSLSFSVSLLLSTGHVTGCVGFTVAVAVAAGEGVGVGVGLGAAETAVAPSFTFAFCLGPAVWRSARVAFVFARASDLVATVVLGDFRGVYPKSASVLLASCVSPNCAMT